MNSIFRKTLIATALSTILSTAAIAEENYQETIDGDTVDQSRQNSQQDNSLNNRNNTDLNNESFEDTIDGDMTADNQGKGQHNRAGKEPCYDDMEATGSGRNPGMDNQDSQNLPQTQHQNNLTEEEEEEEEVMPRVTDDRDKETEMDYSDDTKEMDYSGETEMNVQDDTQMKVQDDTEMNIQMEEASDSRNADNAITSPASNLYSLSADELTGMSVVANDDEEIGYVTSIVLSPDQTEVHAVVTVNSILGLGGRDILVSLEELTQINDDLHIKANEDEIEAMNDYGSDDFVELEGDAALSTAIRVE